MESLFGFRGFLGDLLSLFSPVKIKVNPKDKAYFIYKNVIKNLN